MVEVLLEDELELDDELDDELEALTVIAAAEKSAASAVSPPGIV
jgi:hypothetical protein